MTRDPDYLTLRCRLSRCDVCTSRRCSHPCHDLTLPLDHKDHE